MINSVRPISIPMASASFDTRRDSSLVRDTWRALLKSPSGRVGVLLLALFILLAVFAPILPLQDPLAQDITGRLMPPSSKHWFGTDELGRDILSRVIYGARISLTVGIVAVLISMVLGGIVGLIAGTKGGVFDRVLMRLMDVMMGFPSMLLAIAIVAVRGPGLFNTLLAIGVIRVPIYARLTRSTVLSVRQLEYVTAAQSIGVPSRRIMLRHILPNSISPIIVQGTMGIGTAIVEAAALGFLGLGAQPPEPEWGAMLSSGYIYILRAPWALFAPGAAIFLTVLAFNLLGDALRDAVDPRSRHN